MARLEWSEVALTGLERLVATHVLPSDTRQRVERTAEPLRRFPRLGPELRSADGEELRFLVGPWRWLVIVYLYTAAEDRVVIVAVEDGRGAASTTNRLRSR